MYFCYISLYIHPFTLQFSFHVILFTSLANNTSSRNRDRSPSRSNNLSHFRSSVGTIWNAGVRLEIHHQSKAMTVVRLIKIKNNIREI